MKLSEKHEWDLGYIGVLEDVQDLENKVAQLEEENATLKRALHELAQFDYRLGIDAMREFAFDAIPADTQEGK